MLSLIGIGGAGCRIVDDFYSKNVVSGFLTKLSNKRRGFTGVVADTSDSITKLNSIPKSNMILIGKSRTKGHGTGVNVELGKKIMNEEAELVLNLMSKAGFKKDDLLIIFAGLGGGTGTGSIPVITEKIKKVYKAPLFGVFVLPSFEEGRVHAKNTYDNLQEVVSSVDGAIILDNDIPMKRGGDAISTYKIVDELISKFIILVLKVEENILGNTLDKLSTIAYAKDRSKDISIKGTIEKMLRDSVFLKFDMHSCEKLVFIAKGDMGTLFDQDFARGWIKKKFNCEVEYIFQDEPNAKQVEMGMMITGIKDLSNRFDELIKTKAEEKKRNELDELLGDIQSII
ncbi:MAG: hypothetical protein ACE5J5_02750 [Candidatus Hydrothermarchaeales archaeon]